MPRAAGGSSRPGVIPARRRLGSGVAAIVHVRCGSRAATPMEYFPYLVVIDFQVYAETVTPGNGMLSRKTLTMLRADRGVTIFYRHSTRPDEAGMTRVLDQAHATALKDQLVKRGFLIVEIVPASAMAISGRGGSPELTPHLGTGD